MLANSDHSAFERAWLTYCTGRKKPLFFHAARVLTRDDLFHSARYHEGEGARELNHFILRPHLRRKWKAASQVLDDLS